MPVVEKLAQAQSNEPRVGVRKQNSSYASGGRSATAPVIDLQGRGRSNGTTVERSDKIAPAELQFWLEWAGGKLMAMQIRGTRPSGYRSYWPDFKAEGFNHGYGYTGERLRPQAPNSEQIDLMDQILTLPNLVSDITARRIISARMVITPVSGRYIYTWTRLAQILHTDRRIVRRKFDDGLTTLAANLSPEKIHTLRSRFALLSLSP
jgi:hypothetical protein